MPLSFLSLGDSYTVGEQVFLAENFPYQTVQLLRKAGLEVFAPEIIAKTGWTTAELITTLQQTIFLKKYDIVSLLIGVNNQYRGSNIGEFKNEFTALLKKAIKYGGGNNRNVFVLSIPDWGVTPFAAGRHPENIAVEIDAYNEICRTVSAEYSCTYIEITASQKADGNKPEFLAADGLHPSGLEYAKWAKRLSEAIQLTVV